MRITKATKGWLIVPNTSEEENGLKFILIALYEKYCEKPITTLEGLIKYDKEHPEAIEAIDK